MKLDSRSVEKDNKARNEIVVTSACDVASA
jgi:hypothetical protein